MSVEIFKDINFAGTTSGSLDRDYSNIGDIWNDKISSIKVHSGTWEFFEQPNFQGRSLELGFGEYPSFNNKANDTILSFRKVAAGGSLGQDKDNLEEDIRDFLKRVLDLTNYERRTRGLSELVFEWKLGWAAIKHSRSMAMQDFFDHRQMVERVRAEGYQFSLVGENINAGQSTPEDAVRSWMNSPGHKDNILKPEFKDLGVGYYFLDPDPGSVTYRHYWTQVFGTPQ